MTVVNTAAPHRVVVLALDGVYPFELGIPNRVFGSAAGRYEIRTCSIDGRPVRTSADYDIAVAHDSGALETADTVALPACDISMTLGGELPRPVLDAFARIRPGARIVAICTGAFVAAAAGLLDGRPATTHWNQAEVFRRAFPRVRLDPGVLYVDDGDVLTSAGAAAGSTCACTWCVAITAAPSRTRSRAAASPRRGATAAKRSTSSSPSRARRRPGPPPPGSGRWRT